MSKLRDAILTGRSYETDIRSTLPKHTGGSALPTGTSGPEDLILVMLPPFFPMLHPAKGDPVKSYLPFYLVFLYDRHRFISVTQGKRISYD